MRCKEPIYGKNTPGCPNYVSADSVQNMKGDEKKGDNGAIDASKTEINNAPTALPKGAKPVIKGEMPINPEEFKKMYDRETYDDIKNEPNPYLEKAGYSSFNGKFYAGAKVKAGTLNDKPVIIDIEGTRARMEQQEELEVALYGDGYVITQSTRNVDFSKIKVYVKDDWRVIELPDFDDVMKANNDENNDYGFGVFTITGSGGDIDSQLIDKTVI